MHCCSVFCHLLCISAFDVRVLTGFLICVQICIHLLYGSNLEEQCSGELNMETCQNRIYSSFGMRLWAKQACIYCLSPLSLYSPINGAIKLDKLHRIWWPHTLIYYLYLSQIWSDIQISIKINSISLFSNKCLWTKKIGLFSITTIMFASWLHLFPQH
jgi:hypothetical protein